MIGHPYLSIIIPVYNRQKGLNRVIDSLKSSSEYIKYIKYIEIIVIDDFSKEKIAISGVGNTILIRNSSNIGAPASRRKGYELSKGIFIHFHDSDDGFSENWLKSIIDVIIDGDDFDVMVTARNNAGTDSIEYKYQKYFHKNASDINKVKKRLVYRNCMGPLGGVIFSRSTLSSDTFKSMSSSQDWYMYINSLNRVTRLISRPDVTYDFHIDGDDRISHDSQKKILGFLQLSRTTSQLSFFGRKIRLYYLYTCREHVKAKGGNIHRFYQKNRVSIIFYYLVITVYWRLF